MDEQSESKPMAAFDHARPMTRQFEELDYRETPIGALSLRRKKVLSLGGRIIYEVKVDEGFLMSSLFTVVEEEVARQGLGLLEGEKELDVVVGGLGLGYTAQAALENPSVRSMFVVEALEVVIDWHRQGLVPLGEELTKDSRCQFVQGDFFKLADEVEVGFDAQQPGRKFHAILLDIDHTPDLVLHESHRSFYAEDGLRRLAKHLYPGGVFSMWSDGGVNDEFLANLKKVFPGAEGRRVAFHNPLQNRESASTLYLARKPTEAMT